MPPDEADHNAAYAKVAVAFVTAMARGDFASAHAMLSPWLSDEHPPDVLAHFYRKMFSYAYSQETKEVELGTTITEWPGKRLDDVGWAYVSVQGEDWLEGVSTVVEQHAGRLFIREIDWGRP